MSTLPPLPPHIAKIAGPLLIGHLLHLALFGVLSVQVYIYYLAFPLDPPTRKALVYIIYIAEFVQAILMSIMAFKEFASGFGNFQVLDDTSLLWFAVPVLSSGVAAAVQIFYAYRIKILAHSIILPVLVVLIALFQLGGGIALGVLGEKKTNFVFLEASVPTNKLLAIGIWNGGSALCDVIIAASMTYYLSRMKSEWKPTQRRIQKVIRLVIETGTLTAAVAVVNLAMYLIVLHHPSYYQITSAVLGKMYSTTMMVVLNSRIVFYHNDTTPYELSSMFQQEIYPRPVFSTVNDGIMVTREQWSNPFDGYKLPDTKEPGMGAASNA